MHLTIGRWENIFGKLKFVVDDNVNVTIDYVIPENAVIYDVEINKIVSIIEQMPNSFDWCILSISRPGKVRGCPVKTLSLDTKSKRKAKLIEAVKSKLIGEVEL